MKRRDVKPKRSAVNRHRGAVLKKVLGVVIATILILGTVIGAVGKDNLFTMRAEAGAAHPIVTYVSKPGMDDAQRDGSVHIDLDTFGDDFTYDILAYITDTAEQVTIEQTLHEALEYAVPNGSGTTRVYPVTLLDEAANPGDTFFMLDAFLVPAAAEGLPSVTTEDKQFALDNAVTATLRDRKLEITVNVTDPATGEVREGLRGNWIHFAFDARIREMYAASLEGAAFLAELCDDHENIVSDNGVVPVTDSHTGIRGGASYRVSPAPEDGISQPDAYSNIATVMPGRHSVHLYAGVEGGDAGDISEAEILRGAFGLFVRSIDAPEDERDVTEMFGEYLNITQDPENTTRWETVWKGLPVLHSNMEYVVRVLDAETGLYSDTAYGAYDDDQEIIVPANGPMPDRKMRSLGLKSAPGVTDTVSAHAKIVWAGDDDPNPPASVALTVTGTTAGGTEVSKTVYTIGNDGKILKGSDTTADPDSTVTVSGNEWTVAIGGLAKQTPSDPGPEEDIIYTLEAGSVTAKTGSYGMSHDGSGTDADPYTVTYTYQAPVTTVTMPPVALTVNGAAAAELKTLTEIVTYQITATVPDDAGATLMTVTDTLKGGMQFAGTGGDVTVTVEGNAAVIDNTTELVDPTDNTVRLKAIRAEDETLTVYIPVDVNTRGKQVTVSFRAAIKDDITYEALAAVYKDAKVPNEAEVFGGTFNNTRMGTAKSAAVTIQPVPTAGMAEAGDITLTVNGSKEHTDLAARDDMFTYLIETSVPKGAKSMLITDTLVPVLKNMSKQDEIVVKLGDKLITPSTEVVAEGVSHKAITLDGQTVQVRIPIAEDDKDAEKKVSVQLKAVIRSDMDLSTYDSADGKIPNEASVEVDGDKENVKKSNKVTVKPPEEPGVTKTVNGRETYTLEEDGDTLSYSITARIPLDAETYTLTDSVPDVLIIRSASAKVGGRSMGSANLKRKGQDVYLTLPDATAYAGDTVEMRVKTKLVQGADLALYNNHKVPNTVTVNVNGRLYETSEPATVDGEVLGMRRRGGQTGEESEIPRLIVIVCALCALIVLARHRVDY